MDLSADLPLIIEWVGEIMMTNVLLVRDGEQAVTCRNLGLGFQGFRGSNGDIGTDGQAVGLPIGLSGSANKLVLIRAVGVHEVDALSGQWTIIFRGKEVA